MENSNKILYESLNDYLFPLANKNKALEMDRYMKNNFSFLGIHAPIRKKVFSDWLKTIAVNDFLNWNFIHFLMNQKHREYHYCAVELSEKLLKKNIEETDINHIIKLITTHSWWDTVDFVSSHCLGMYFKKYPNNIPQFISKCNTSQNLWLLRSTLIFQLFYKDKTDFELLKSQIFYLQKNKEFFIQKAIGWSLRQYAKTEAKKVQDFVNSPIFAASNLAKREALKLLK